MDSEVYRRLDENIKAGWAQQEFGGRWAAGGRDGGLGGEEGGAWSDMKGRDERDAQDEIERFRLVLRHSTEGMAADARSRGDTKRAMELDEVSRNPLSTKHFASTQMFRV